MRTFPSYRWQLTPVIRWKRELSAGRNLATSENEGRIRSHSVVAEDQHQRHLRDMHRLILVHPDPSTTRKGTQTNPIVRDVADATLASVSVRTTSAAALTRFASGMGRRATSSVNVPRKLRGPSRVQFSLCVLRQKLLKRV